MVDLQDILKMKLKDTMLNSESELKIDSVLQNNSVSEILIFLIELFKVNAANTYRYSVYNLAAVYEQN